MLHSALSNFVTVLKSKENRDDWVTEYQDDLLHLPEESGQAAPGDPDPGPGVEQHGDAGASQLRSEHPESRGAAQVQRGQP